MLLGALLHLLVLPLIANSGAGNTQLAAVVAREAPNATAIAAVAAALVRPTRAASSRVKGLRAAAAWIELIESLRLFSVEPKCGRTGEIEAAKRSLKIRFHPVCRGTSRPTFLLAIL